MRDPALPVTVAVLGDSHAQALYPALDAVMAERKMKGIFLALGGCAPLRELRSDVKPLCKEIVEAVLATINRHGMINTVTSPRSGALIPPVIAMPRGAATTTTISRPTGRRRRTGGCSSEDSFALLPACRARGWSSSPPCRTQVLRSSFCEIHRGRGRRAEYGLSGLLATQCVRQRGVRGTRPPGGDRQARRGPL